MLALPLAGQFEQEMNARYLERLGLARRPRPWTRRRWSASSSASRCTKRPSPATSRTATERRSPTASWRAARRTAAVSELELGRTLLLFAWAFGLAAIEIEIEGGWGWAERLPTWWRSRGARGSGLRRRDGPAPLTGYHVWAFAIPLIVLNLPYVMGVEWTLAGELRTLATFFALAVVWDYLWFVLNPAYTVKRFERGKVWWFEVPWFWRSRWTTTSASASRSGWPGSPPGRRETWSRSGATCG